MFSRFTKIALLVGLLAAPLAVQAADVLDSAEFFSADAIAKANTTIREIKSKFGHDIRIETYATVPSEKVQTVSKMSAKERDAFYASWLRERAEATQSRGIFILITKHPAHLHLWAGNPLQRAGFDAAHAAPIRETLLSGFKAKDYDGALSDALAQIKTAFAGLHGRPGQAAAGPSAPVHPRPMGPNVRQPAGSSGFGGVLFVLAIVVGGIFLISIISRVFSGRSGGYQPGGPPPPYGSTYGGGYGYGGGGGGGFMRGLAGGIFGAMAGNWMYDQFSGRHAHGSDSGWSGPHSTGGFGGDSSGSDTGYDGGSDFGGGDFGGGDSGGGDAGGGDF